MSDVPDILDSLGRYLIAKAEDAREMSPAAWPHLASVTKDALREAAQDLQEISQEDMP